MCMYSSTDGLAETFHLVHLGSRAIGGAGFIMVEATAVEPEGRISLGCAGMWTKEHAERIKPAVEFCKQYGAIVGLQIGHAGRKGSTKVPWEDRGSSLKPEEGAWETKAPSAIPFGGNITHIPRAITVADIADIKQKFVTSAKLALEAGFQVLEIHSAHGYLLNEFLSPLTNKRTDEYGGTFENRTRFLVETCEAVRAVWPIALPLWVRISCVEWVDGGWTLEDSVALAKILKTKGVDTIDCSSGFNDPDISKIKFAAGFQVPFTETIRKEAGIATAAVGEIWNAKLANSIIEEGKADLVLNAKEFLRDPYFAYHAAEELGYPKPYTILPIQYIATMRPRLPPADETTDKGAVAAKDWKRVALWGSVVAAAGLVVAFTLRKITK